MTLSKEQKKEATSKYKARKIPRGVFLVRCTVNGEVWVGSSRDVDAARNSMWFSLRIGNHRESSLQQAWTAHGESAFEYEVIEIFKEDVPSLLLPDLLKQRKLHWMKNLKARGLL